MAESGKRGSGAALAGGGPSLVGARGAMRARDVSKPTDEDLAEAEKRVVIRRVPADRPFKSNAAPPTTGEPRTP